jgi:hypothetical protein
MKPSPELERERRLHGHDERGEGKRVERHAAPSEGGSEHEHDAHAAGAGDRGGGADEDVVERDAEGDDEPRFAAAHEQLTDGQQEAHDDEDVVSTQQNTKVVALGFNLG